MNCERKRVWLPYAFYDYCEPFEFLDRDKFENGGRYRIRTIWRPKMGGRTDPSLRDVTVYTHPPRRSATAAEATVMCGYRLNHVCWALAHIAAAPRFDLETAWRELAVLERAALGRVVYG